MDNTAFNSNAVPNNGNNSNLNIAEAISSANVGLFIINAHSKEPSESVRIPYDFSILHYCPPSCRLRTVREVKGEPEVIVRQTSLEYACMRQLPIYKKSKKKCPAYTFYTTNEDDRHGLFFCDGNSLKQIDELVPDKHYELSEIIERIQMYREITRLDVDLIELGLMSCRSTRVDAKRVYALPPGAGKRASHPAFSLTRNSTLNQARRKNQLRNRSRNRSNNRSNNRKSNSRGAAEKQNGNRYPKNGPRNSRRN